MLYFSRNYSVPADNFYWPPGTRKLPRSFKNLETEYCEGNLVLLYTLFNYALANNGVLSIVVNYNANRPWSKSNILNWNYSPNTFPLFAIAFNTFMLALDKLSQLLYYIKQVIRRINWLTEKFAITPSMYFRAQVTTSWRWALPITSVI